MTDKTQGQEQQKSDKVHGPQAPAAEGLERSPQPDQPAAALQRVMGAPPPAVNPADIVTLQRAMGNRAVRDLLGRQGDAGGRRSQGERAGAIQREGPDAGVAEPADAGAHEPAGVAADPEAAALQEFLEQGMMPDATGEDVVGSSNMGGFNAKFDPDERKLIATLNVGVSFHHGLSINATTGVVSAVGSGFNTSADDIAARTALGTQAANVTAAFPTIADRVREVNSNWRWADSEKDLWMARYENAVLDAWDNRHTFQSRRWAELQSSVNVRLNIHEGDQDGDHTAARIIKTPPGGMDTAYVDPGTSGTQDQELLMSSSGTGGNTTNFLRYSLQFADGSASLRTAVGTVHGGDAGPAYLNKFIADFREGRRGEGVPIEIIGRASATGNPEANRRLSNRRASNVASYLRSHGLTGAVRRLSRTGAGSDGATEDASWRRVDIVVGSGEAQNTAAHEFGHMLGLGDEYSSPAGGFYPGAGTPVPVGDPATHNALASKMGGGVTGAVGENTDSIMSVGNTVRPQHYAIFHKAIEQVTDETWQYGAAAPGRVRTLPATGGPAPTTAVA